MVELVSNDDLHRRFYRLSPPSEHPVCSIFICDMHLLLILHVSNKKFAHIFEGNNIPTHPRRSVSPNSHLDVRFQPATAPPPPLSLPQLAGWTLPAPCARAPPAAVESPIDISWCPTPTTAQCFPVSEKLVGHVWAVSRTYPIHFNCTDSRPRSRWYQVRGLPRVGSECFFPQCSSSFAITRGSAKRSAFGLSVHLSRAHDKSTQKKWNSLHSKFSNRQMPNGTTTAVQNGRGAYNCFKPLPLLFR